MKVATNSCHKIPSNPLRTNFMVPVRTLRKARAAPTPHPSTTQITASHHLRVCTIKQLCDPAHCHGGPLAVPPSRATREPQTPCSSSPTILPPHRPLTTGTGDFQPTHPFGLSITATPLQGSTWCPSLAREAPTWCWRRERRALPLAPPSPAGSCPCATALSGHRGRPYAWRAADARLIFQGAFQMRFDRH